VALKKGMEIALQVVIEFLKDMTMPVSSEDEIFNVCMVSSNYDSLIARIVAKTMITVGINGSVNIVESPTGDTRFNLVNGLIYDRGLVTDAFATEFKVEQRCEMEYPLVMVVTNKITDVKEITHILDLVKKTKKPLVVFSEDLQEEPLSMMVYNNSKDIIKCCAINVPWMANMQKEMLTDIAVATGATLIDNEYEIKLKDVTLDHFGSAKKIVADMNQAHIIGGGG
jgi:chaperonin GroEL